MAADVQVIAVLVCASHSAMTLTDLSAAISGDAALALLDLAPAGVGPGEDTEGHQAERYQYQ